MSKAACDFTSLLHLTPHCPPCPCAAAACAAALCATAKLDSSLALISTYSVLVSTSWPRESSRTSPAPPLPLRSCRLCSCPLRDHRPRQRWRPRPRPDLLSRGHQQLQSTLRHPLPFTSACAGPPLLTLCLTHTALAGQAFATRTLCVSRATTTTAP